LIGSYFTNVDGLPYPKVWVTPRDMAQIARHTILNYPDYYKWFGEREFTLNKIRQQNRNPLLGLVDGTDGMKTGFTNEACYNLVGSAVQHGGRLIVVVTGLKNAKDRADDAKKLVDYGFKNFDSRILFAEGQTVAEAKAYGGAQGRVAVAAKGPVRAPVRQGQDIGSLQVWRGDANVLDVPVQASGNVATGSVPQRAFDAASELVINLFRSAAKRI
ncbi:MAG: D-alanyl-D-alanine carboxypeptidase, partial [Xanthobacteraceae bacterium]|nr:D-alanyl-D-alanine carboxypeptidase [Xanthobacteraceae bacterium]